MCFGTVQASTDVSGIIALDATWTQAGSPYTLTGNLLVEKRARLKFNPQTQTGKLFCQAAVL